MAILPKTPRKISRHALAPGSPATQQAVSLRSTADE